MAGSGVGVAVRDSTNKASVGSIIGNGNGHSHSPGYGGVDGGNRQVLHVDTLLTCLLYIAPALFVNVLMHIILI